MAAVRVLLPVTVACVACVACGGGSVPHRDLPPPPDPGDVNHAQFGSDAEPPPSYSQAELARAIDAERAAIASGEQGSGADEVLAATDLGVRRRFLASLEACRETQHGCPPRIDAPAWAYDPDVDVVPPLETPLRFDLADWRTIAEELHGRACACRTIGCVDTVGIAIDVLEPRPIGDVRGDEQASASITRARECLFRLRGKELVRGHAAAPVYADTPNK
jgi:hypothetical protein